MLQLPNITLICIATRNIESASDAITLSCNGIEWGSIKLVSSYRPWNYPPEMIYIQIPEFETIDDWNKFIFYDLYKYIDTEYCLLIHPDGHVINPDKWDDRFLQYDYIGAPWSADTIHDVYGNEVRVGNSVSIRSKRLLELPSKLNLPWTEYNGSFNEDTQICAHYRPYFIGAGMTFAPVEIAVLFAHEIPVPETVGITPFAFHYWEPAAPKFAPFELSDIYAGYVNLDSRTDRLSHIQHELTKLSIPAFRQRGILPEEVLAVEPDDKTYVMLHRTPGALGCWAGQVAIMQTALEQNKHALVFEDDVVLCDDINDRLNLIKNFCDNHDWDIIWLGGTYHVEPTWHKKEGEYHTHPDMQFCECDLNRDWESTDDINIVRTYGCWSTYAYIVNRKRIPIILERLNDNMYRSQGIDHCMIYLQAQLDTFAFNPGCVKQYDNQSNIGNGITQFSTFQSLGKHWFADKLVD